MPDDAVSRLRSFLSRHYLRLRHVVRLLQNGFLFLLISPARRLLDLARRLAHRAKMAFRTDSKVDLSLPYNHHIRYLKTKEECRLGNETIQIWTVEMPSKHAEGILKVIKENIAGQDSVDLQHLRRFAKPKYLPRHVVGLRDIVKEMYLIPHAWESAPLAVAQAPATSVWEFSTMQKPRQKNSPQTLYLLICPCHLVKHQDLHDLLLQHPPFCSSPESWAYPLEIKAATVPRLAPTSPQQADTWSADYWPTFYRKTNPFGAHPGSIEKAEAELQFPLGGNVGIKESMALARQAAHETQRMGFGVGPGCVIVERVDGKTEILAVAGDARHKPLARSMMGDGVPTACTGNVMGHAAMRAIGMIGRKRLRVASQIVSTRAAKAERSFEHCGLDHDEAARDAFFLDLPMNSLEEHYFRHDNIKPDGYLCLRLEIFLTHEPCIMCSMALVHSRVGRVVFGERMSQTGGLTAEMASNDSGPVGLGYGLCWRKELNWQFMCWEYQQVEENKAAATKRIGNVDHDDGTTTEHQHDQDDTNSDTTFTPTKSPSKLVMLSDDNANVSSFASIHV